MPDEAVIRLRAAPTSCMLRNARAAHAGRVLHAPCTEIEQNLQRRSRVFSRKSARFRTPQLRNLDAGQSSDSAQSCADVVHVAQRTRRTPAEFCMRLALKSNKICSGVRA